MSNSRELRRLVRQTLEAYRSAGLEHMPLAAAPVAAPEPTAVAPPRSPQPEVPAGPRPAGSVPWARTAAPAPDSYSPPSLRPAIPEIAVPNPVMTATPTTRPPDPPAPLPLTATREDRAAVLEVLNQRVRACTRCVELANSRTNTVFGVGDPATRILFLGEAPGADEDQQGEPFVGKAGQLLNSIIEACQLKRSEVYICNVLKCRPPGNRTPLESECQNCREFLDGQLAAVDPEYIICWGTTAAQNLLQTKQPIGKLRRQFFRHGRARVLCTYHPSYLLRNPPAKKDVWEDMKFWRAEMGVDLSGVKKSG